MWLLYIFTNGYIGPCVCVYDFRFVNMHHLCLIRNQADLRQIIQVCIRYIDKLLFNTKHSHFFNICIQYATPTPFCKVLNKIIDRFQTYFLPENSDYHFYSTAWKSATYTLVLIPEQKVSSVEHCTYLIFDICLWCKWYIARLVWNDDIPHDVVWHGDNDPGCPWCLTSATHRGPNVHCVCA